MLTVLVIGTILAIPGGLFCWLLGRVVGSKPILRVALGSLLGCEAAAICDLWADWMDGFCCRDYPATIWTELPRFLLVGLIPVPVAFSVIWLVRVVVVAAKNRRGQQEA